MNSKIDEKPLPFENAHHRRASLPFQRSPNKRFRVKDATASMDSELAGATPFKPIAGYSSPNVRLRIPDAAVSDIISEPEGATSVKPISGSKQIVVYPNGYTFPPKKPWRLTTKLLLLKLWRFTLTPVGFLIVVYGLNVVGWGFMIFLLLVNWVPSMCDSGPRGCHHTNSPREIWIEIDSQVLTGLFCVTAFGLAPWRFRDLYYLIKFRVGRDYNSLRILAGHNAGWFRLPGSQVIDPLETFAEPTDADEANPSVTLPPHHNPQPPPTGIRAPPTKLWKLELLIWGFFLNTCFQVGLCFFMWHYNRHDRPPWSEWTFCALALTSVCAAGLVPVWEGRQVEKVEGVSVKEKICDVHARKKGLEGAERGEGVRAKEKGLDDVEMVEVLGVVDDANKL